MKKENLDDDESVTVSVLMFFMTILMIGQLQNYDEHNIKNKDDYIAT